MDTDIVLDVADLTVRVPSARRTDVDRPREDLVLVDSVSLRVRAGERLALVGESGSGKSMTAKAVMRLDPTVQLDGSIRLGGSEVVGADDRTLRALRGGVAAMVFQDPMTALNPVIPIGAQVAEPLIVRGVPRRQARRRAVEMLDRLGVPDAARRARAYPSEFSGGMRQRVVIAAALIAGPRLLIADEPTTALDVRVQQQVLDLLEEQSEQLGLAVLLITHDLGIVAGLAHRVAVMRRGSIVETGEVDEIFARPRHPYTRGLLASVPRLDADLDSRLVTVDDIMRAEDTAERTPA
ncbi:MAG: ABC transporter ATP-binding protein [Microbacterium sp.]|uniref:ABC transporter ATP-binding protein n=1 Tax=Microbacterium sp. TaxID=51671 RepID=UPI0039E61275